MFVRDENGKEYLEGLAGLWCASLGFSEKRLADAAYRQMLKLPFYHTFAGKAHDTGIELAEKLLSIAPVQHVEGFLHQLGVGSQRHRGEAGLVLQQRAGSAEEEENSGADEGLSRRYRRQREPHRAA